jgi:hypothetical protein
MRGFSCAQGGLLASFFRLHHITHTTRSTKSYYCQCSVAASPAMSGFSCAHGGLFGHITGSTKSRTQLHLELLLVAASPAMSGFSCAQGGLLASYGWGVVFQLRIRNSPAGSRSRQVVSRVVGHGVKGQLVAPSERASCEESPPH